MRMTSRQPREQQNSRASTGHHSLSSHTKIHPYLHSHPHPALSHMKPQAQRLAMLIPKHSHLNPSDPFGRPGRLIQSTASPKKKSPVAKDKTTPVVSPSQPTSFKPLSCCLALSMHLLLPQRGFHGLLMRAISRCRAVFYFVQGSVQD